MKKSSLFDKAEQHEALQGPIQLKDPNSFEFAYQQLYWIKVLYSSWNSSLQEWKAAVEKADEFRIYDRLPDPAHPYGSLDAMLKAEIGVMEAEGSRVVDARERSRLAAVNTTGEVLPRGGDQKSEAKESMSNFDIDPQGKRGERNGVSRFTQNKIDRLARDFPEFHERVRTGELSVHGACVAAGIARRTVQVPDDPHGASRAIVRHFQGDALLTLIRDQANWVGGEFIEPVDGAVSMPELTPEQHQAFNRVIQFSDKLFEALEDLEAHGGLKALARVIRPGSIEKATTALKGVRQAIDDQLAGLKTDRPRPKPKPKPQSPTPPPSPPAPADPDPPAGAADTAPVRRARRDRS